MTKKVKLSFVLISILFAIVIAFKSLVLFFEGAIGLPFVAMLAIISVLTIFNFTSKETATRIKDLFIVSCIFTIYEFFMYFFIEFRIAGYKMLEVLYGIQYAVSFIAILFVVYLVFRAIYEVKGLNIKFFEIMLGTQKRGKRQKKAKDIKNGSLQEKPSKQKESKENATENKTGEKLPGQEVIDIDNNLTNEL